VRAWPLLLAATLLVSCGAPSSQPARSTSESIDVAADDPSAGRYGLSIAGVNGWDVEIARGAIRFANRPLPKLALCGGPRELDPADLVVDILERDPPAAERGYFRALDKPPQISTGDLGPPEPGTYPAEHAVATVPFSLGSRFFVLFAESGARSVEPAVIDQANRILATLRVEPGDFYPGDVEPAAFRPADGWHTGSSGSRPVGADGDWTVSWASTVPYRDRWDALPMRETLESLPADGIVVWASLSRFCDPNDPRRSPVHPRPYRLAEFEVLPGWEGQVRDLPEYRLWTRIPAQYDVDLRVYFGQAEPTVETLDRAQDELDRLELPDWGPWELE
jgi:hypothetical protein